MGEPEAGASVVGVDGWKKQWVAVVARGGAVEGVRTFASFAKLAKGLDEAAVIAVDMPIGLPEAGRRGADVEAKRLLGECYRNVWIAEE